VQIVGVAARLRADGGAGATALRLTQRVFAGIVVSMALAVIIAWISLSLAFLTDWPTSFWITALGTIA